jgi:hypothetical protein
MVMWIIFAGSQEPGRTADSFIAMEGTVTRDKKLSAKFPTYMAAEKFAKSKNITIDAHTRYIGQTSLEESDI